MVGADATQIGPKIAECRGFCPNLLDFCRMPTATGAYEIHSEARGPHWIAWVSRDGSGKPERSVVLVAETRELAEERTRRWAEQTSY